jgi:hypothetical protein
MFRFYCFYFCFILSELHTLGAIIFTGSYTENFTAAPSSTGWTTGTSTGSATTFNNITGGNNSILTEMNQQTTSFYGSAIATGTLPSSSAVYSSSGGYVATQGSNGLTVVQLALTNNTGGVLSAFSFQYNYNVVGAVPSGSLEQFPGYLFFYSTNGTSWTYLNELSMDGSAVGNPGINDSSYSDDAPSTGQTLSYSFSGLSVANGSNLYFRWVDDNGPNTTERDFSLDNIFISTRIMH